MPCFDLSGEPSTCDTVGSSAFSVPDRLTGYSALSELNPQRQWNFVEVSGLLAVDVDRKGCVFLELAHMSRDIYLSFVVRGGGGGGGG